MREKLLYLTAADWRRLALRGEVQAHWLKQGRHAQPCNRHEWCQCTYRASNAYVANQIIEGEKTGKSLGSFRSVQGLFATLNAAIASSKSYLPSQFIPPEVD